MENKSLKKVVLVVICTAVSMCAYTVLGMVLRKFNLGNIYPLLIAEAFLTICAIVIMKVCNKKNLLKFTTKGMGTGFLLGIVLLINPVMGIFGYYGLVIAGMQSIAISTMEFIVFAITMFLVGVAEELLFRGNILDSLLEYFGEDSPNNVRKAIIVSGILFGCGHGTNIIKGASLLGVIPQMISAGAMGVLLAVIYYRSNKNIWPVIVIHALTDFSSFSAAGLLDGKSATEVIGGLSMQVILYSLFMLAFAIFFMRNKKIEPLLSKK